MRLQLLASLVTLILSAPLTFAAPESSKPQPNIVILMADDLGLGSTGPYGAPPHLVRTPHINRLAASGLAFDRAYVTASVCSPTRYGMLTGRYSWRTRLQFGVINSMDALLIDPGTPTLASWLQEHGYQTAHFGKWHLGYKAETFENLLGRISPGPNDVGFDYHFGVPNNMDDVHKVWIENDRIYGLRSDRISPYGKSFYGRPYFGYDAPQRHEPLVMEEITQRAVNWIDTRDRTRPFFLYFAAVAVHHPIMPSPRMLGTSAAGAYGDFIHDLDYAAGQIIDALAHRGLLENTLFIFTSDNGGDIPEEARRPERQAEAAGLAINGSLRGDKHTIYEGGLRVPLIISWPGHIPAAERTNAFVTTVDFFATVAEIVSGRVPAPNLAAPDSFSFAEVLRDPSAPSSRPHGVFRDVAGRQAVRFSDWKLVDSHRPRNPEHPEPIELYNLADDPAESTNLAAAYPERVAAGRQLLQAIRDARASRDVPAPR